MSSARCRILFRTMITLVAVTVAFAGCTTIDAPVAPVESAGNDTDLLPAAEGKTSYPLTLQSPYGTTTIKQRPVRIATVGANAMDAELVLALGAIPVTAAGLGFNKAPWLIDAAQGRIDTVFETESWDEYPYEELAAAQPDVIIAFGYDLTKAYADLSAIAPVVTSDRPWTGYFSNPWQDNIMIIGEVLDLADSANRVINDYDTRISQIRAQHPEFADQSLSYTVWFGPERGLSFQSLPDSIITDVFTQIGFDPAPQAAKFTETQTVSPELLDTIDADVLVIAGSTAGTKVAPDTIPGLTDSGVFQNLSAWRSGQVVITESTSEVGWAMSTAGPLGSMVALDILVPRIADVLR